MRKLDPNPKQDQRAAVSERVRIEAANLSRQRLGAPIDQRNNQESELLDPPVTTFTKSMPHDDYGIVCGSDFEVMIGEINQDGTNGNESPFVGTYTSMKPARFEIPLHPGNYHTNTEGPRTWESPLSGHIYELEGPDPDTVAMPPAPKLGSAELTAEMADLYGMALCRDIPFEEIEAGTGTLSTGQTVNDLLVELNKFSWNNKTSVSGQALSSQLDDRQTARRNARLDPSDDKLSVRTLFRGSTPGALTGPYISQFFLIGTADREDNSNRNDRAQPVSSKGVTQAMWELTASPRAVAGPPGTLADIEVQDGFIRYGQQLINQRILPQINGKDYLADWGTWCDVQNGADRKNTDTFGYEDPPGTSKLPTFGRFIHAPRDLATFVHFDELYQAYHNAMLIMLGLGVGSDIGLPEGSGHPTRDAFATFGGPHILTLLPEVATRALKAVRRQKYQIHLRARPEALGGVVTLAAHAAQNHRLNNVLPLAEQLLTELNSTSLAGWVATHNEAIGAADPDAVTGWIDNDKNLLLSQAFPEGSPVHGSYGAGHATVAGACTTILKAFFELYNSDLQRGSTPLAQMIATAPEQLFPTAGGANAPIDLKDLTEEYYITGDDTLGNPGGALHPWSNPNNETLTIEGELDKLAANVSIGRNFGGVHYYTDYYESLRMGERIAAGMLQEQMLTYREPVSMRFTSFDGDSVMITGSGGSRGLDDAQIHVWERGSGNKINDLSLWWNRCLIES